jgi:hypothetical protein
MGFQKSRLVANIKKYQDNADTISMRCAFLIIIMLFSVSLSVPAVSAASPREKAENAVRAKCANFEGARSSDAAGMESIISALQNLYSGSYTQEQEGSIFDQLQLRFGSICRNSGGSSSAASTTTVSDRMAADLLLMPTVGYWPAGKTDDLEYSASSDDIKNIADSFMADRSRGHLMDYEKQYVYDEVEAYTKEYDRILWDPNTDLMLVRLQELGKTFRYKLDQFLGPYKSNNSSLEKYKSTEDDEEEDENTNKKGKVSTTAEQKTAPAPTADPEKTKEDLPVESPDSNKNYVLRYADSDEIKWKGKKLIKLTDSVREYLKKQLRECGESWDCYKERGPEAGKKVSEYKDIWLSFVKLKVAPDSNTKALRDSYINRKIGDRDFIYSMHELIKFRMEKKAKSLDSCYLTLSCCTEWKEKAKEYTLISAVCFLGTDKKTRESGKLGDRRRDSDGFYRTGVSACAENNEEYAGDRFKWTKKACKATCRFIPADVEDDSKDCDVNKSLLIKAK